MEDLLMQISNIGFPIAVSCYLLVRFESRIGELTNSINELSKYIERLID